MYCWLCFVSMNVLNLYQVHMTCLLGLIYYRCWWIGSLLLFRSYSAFGISILVIFFQVNLLASFSLQATFLSFVSLETNKNGERWLFCWLVKVKVLWENCTLKVWKIELSYDYTFDYKSVRLHTIFYLKVINIKLWIWRNIL